MDGHRLGFGSYRNGADAAENVNAAEQPEYQDRVRKLSQMLAGGWKRASP